MFDIVKDYNALLVTVDQGLSMKGQDFYMKVCIDVEVAKNQKDTDFRRYITNTVNAKIRGYLTNFSLSLDKIYEASNFIMLSCVLEYFHNKEFKLDDEDISLISNNLNLENAEETLKEHFSNKYGESQRYLELAKEFVGPLNYALSVYSNYRPAKSSFSITQQHLNTFKMIMGKEFMDSCYAKH